MKLILLTIFGIIWILSIITGIRLIYKVLEIKRLFDHPADCETYYATIVMVAKDATITSERGTYYLKMKPHPISYPDLVFRFPIHCPSSTSVLKWSQYRFKCGCGGDGGSGASYYYNTNNKYHNAANKSIEDIIIPNPIYYFTNDQFNKDNSCLENMDIDQVNLKEEQLTFGIYIHFIQNGIPIPSGLQDGLVCIVNDTNVSESMDIPNHYYYVYTDSQIRSAIRSDIEDFIMLHINNRNIGDAYNDIHDMMRSKQPYRYKFTILGKAIYIR